MLAPTERLAERVKWWVGLVAGFGLLLTVANAAVLSEDLAVFALALIAVYLVVFLGAGVEFSRWMYRVTKNCEALGAGFNRSAGWAVASFFIPIANLFVPYWHMSEIASWARFRDPKSVGIGVWWTAWIVSTILDNLGGRLTGTPNAELNEVGHLVSVLGAIGTIAAAVTCVGMMRNVERAFAERLDSLSPRPNPPAATVAPAAT